MFSGIGARRWRVERRSGLDVDLAVGGPVSLPSNSVGRVRVVPGVGVGLGTALVGCLRHFVDKSKRSKSMCSVSSAVLGRS
ncbi:hypothetical protein Aduo_003094 [Ancylostoma duodenale]